MSAAERLTPMAPPVGSAKANGTPSLGPISPRRFAAAIMRPEQWPLVEPPARWAVSGLRLGIGRPNLFNGKGGIGKTLVAQYVVMCRLGGVAGLGGLIAEAAPISSAIHVDADQGGRATRARYHRLAATLGVVQRPSFLALEDADGFSPKSHADWTDVLAGHQLAVIDSLSSLLSLGNLNENDPSDTKSIMTALRAAGERVGCAQILITHSGHDIEDKAKAYQRTRPRGSSAIGQGAGTIWSFTGSEDRGSIRSAKLTRESEQDDGAEFVREWSYRIGTSDARADAVGRIAGLDIVRAEAERPTESADGEIPDDVEEAIVWALSAGPLSASTLASRIRKGKTAVRDALANLGSSVVLKEEMVRGNRVSKLMLVTSGGEAVQSGDL